MVVKDWRYVVRICNIDISDLLGSANTQTAAASTNLIKLMARALYRIPNMAMGRAAFYMNRTVHSGMSIAALDKSTKRFINTRRFITVWISTKLLIIP